MTHHTIEPNSNCKNKYKNHYNNDNKNDQHHFGAKLLLLKRKESKTFTSTKYIEILAILSIYIIILVVIKNSFTYSIFFLKNLKIKLLCKMKAANNEILLYQCDSYTSGQFILIQKTITFKITDLALLSLLKITVQYWYCPGKIHKEKYEYKKKRQN